MKIAPECVGRQSGSKICQGDSISVCSDLVLSTPDVCDGTARVCRMIDGRGTCVCATGSVDKGQGCELATDCTDQGGCDLNTVCTVQNGAPVCSDCPPGFSGTGRRGCVPELSALGLSAGELTPAFSPGVHGYRVHLPLLQQRLRLMPSAPPGTTFEVDGTPLDAGATWTSAVLPLGEHMIQLRLLSKSGVSNDYQLTVEHAGIQEAYVKAAKPDVEDNFGNSLALYGDTLVVGSVFDDSGSRDPADNSVSDAGAVYVYTRRGSVWVQDDYLKAEAPAVNDFYGISVAVWEDTIAVGMPRSSPYGNTTPRAGVVYIYVRTADGWVQQEKLAISDGGAQDLFGFSVALRHDLLVVGAPYESSQARQSGALYVFQRSGDSWGVPVKLKGSQPHAEASLGWSLALDGDTLVAGAQDHSGTSTNAVGPGAAYVFVHSDSGWPEQQRLQAPQPTAAATFGWSVAVLGDTLAVGAPRADLLKPTLNGAAYVYQRSGGRWTHTRSFAAPNPRNSDYFGSSVALSSETLLVGAQSDASGARGFGGETARDDATGSGAIYMYGKQEDGWVDAAFIKALNADSGDGFGEHLALHGDSVATSAIGECGGSPGVNGDASSNNLRASGAIYVFR